MFVLVILPVLASMLTGMLSATTYSDIPIGTDPKVNGSSDDIANRLVMEKQDISKQKEVAFAGEPVQRPVRRRSVNLPDPDKPRFNRLLKVHRNRFLKVNEDGDVVTTTDSNSQHTKIEVQFMCHVYPERFRSCSPSSLVGHSSGDETAATTSSSSSSSSSSSVYSSILLRFAKTNRYLCMDEKATIYTKHVPVNRTSLDVSECVFEHDFLPNQYDVYSSLKYPRNSTLCLDADSSPKRNGNRKRRFCSMRWFIGVGKNLKVVAVKTSKSPNSKTFFIQRWVNDHSTHSNPHFNFNPYQEAKLSRQNNSVVTGSNSSTPTPPTPRSRNKSEKPISRFLTKLTPNRNRQTAAEHKSTECGNLLKNCDHKHHHQQQQKEGRHTQKKKRKQSLLPPAKSPPNEKHTDSN